MDRALEICPKAQRKQQGQQEPVTVMLRIYINLFQLFGFGYKLFGCNMGYLTLPKPITLVHDFDGIVSFSRQKLAEGNDSRLVVCLVRCFCQRWKITLGLRPDTGGDYTLDPEWEPGFPLSIVNNLINRAINYGMPSLISSSGRSDLQRPGIRMSQGPRKLHEWLLAFPKCPSLPYSILPSTQFGLLGFMYSPWCCKVPMWAGLFVCYVFLLCDPV